MAFISSSKLIVFDCLALEKVGNYVFGEKINVKEVYKIALFKENEKLEGNNLIVVLIENSCSDQTEDIMSVIRIKNENEYDLFK